MSFRADFCNFVHLRARSSRIEPKCATSWRLSGFSGRVLQRRGGMGVVSVILVRPGAGLVRIRAGSGMVDWRFERGFWRIEYESCVY